MECELCNSTKETLLIQRNKLFHHTSIKLNAQSAGADFGLLQLVSYAVKSQKILFPFPKNIYILFVVIKRQQKTNT